MAWLVSHHFAVGMWIDLEFMADTDATRVVFAPS